MAGILLDITPFEEKISLHSYLKDMLKFPFYYGANLDALYDELTSMETPVEITLKYHNHDIKGHENYIPRLAEVFRIAAQDNYNIQLTMQETDAKAQEEPK